MQIGWVAVARRYGIENGMIWKMVHGRKVRLGNVSCRWHVVVACIGVWGKCNLVTRKSVVDR